MTSGGVDDARHRTLAVACRQHRGRRTQFVLDVELCLTKDDPYSEQCHHRGSQLRHARHDLLDVHLELVCPSSSVARCVHERSGEGDRDADGADDADAVREKKDAADDDEQLGGDAHHDEAGGAEAPLKYGGHGRHRDRRGAAAREWDRVRCGQ